MVYKLLLRIASLAALFMVASTGFAKEPPRQTATRWEGYLIDIACGLERKNSEPDLGVKHTKKCLMMPACDRSGFGLLTDDNELWRFNEEGNRKVRLLIMKLNRHANLRIIVQGAKSGDVIEVRRVSLR